jgi:hypothetical protein
MMIGINHGLYLYLQNRFKILVVSKSKSKMSMWRRSFSCDSLLHRKQEESLASSTRIPNGIPYVFCV